MPIETAVVYLIDLLGWKVSIVDSFTHDSPRYLDFDTTSRCRFGVETASRIPHYALISMEFAVLAAEFGRAGPPFSGALTVRSAESPPGP